MNAELQIALQIVSTQEEKTAAFEWLRSQVLEGNRHAKLILADVAALRTLNEDAAKYQEQCIWCERRLAKEQDT